jgi:hypothetical protein
MEPILNYGQHFTEYYMPLTMNGICVQILSSPASCRAHPVRCTDSECKVVLNHLVRKFSEPLNRDAAPTRICSTLLANYDGPMPEDHVLPVKVITHRLLH